MFKLCLGLPPVFGAMTLRFFRAGLLLPLLSGTSLRRVWSANLSGGKKLAHTVKAQLKIFG